MRYLLKTLSFFSSIIKLYKILFIYFEIKLLEFVY